MDLKEQNIQDIQVEEEIKNNKSNQQFLMIKDNYCIGGLDLSPPLACFFSFLVFMSDRFLHNNKGKTAFIGYSNKSLAQIYSAKWFKISERTVVQYLKELKEKDLINIENNRKNNRKIYINYVKIRPELLNMVKDDTFKEYQNKIEELSKEVLELKEQNNILMNQLVNQNTDIKESTVGLFTKILYDKKYLTKKDNLTRSQLEDYNAMLKSFLFLYQKEGLDFFKSVYYVCSRADLKKIHDKFSYLYSCLNNYLEKYKNIPNELYSADDE